MVGFEKSLKRSAIFCACLFSGSLVFASAGFAHGGGAGGGGMATSGIHGGIGGGMAGRLSAPGGFGTMPRPNQPKTGQAGSGFSPDPHHAQPQPPIVDPPGSDSGSLTQPRSDAPLKGQPGDRNPMMPHPNGG